MTEKRSRGVRKDQKDGDTRDPGEARFRVVVDGFSDPILILDEYRLIRYVNYEFLHVFRYQLADVIGIPMEQLLPAEEREEFARYFREGLSINGSKLKFEHRLLRQDHNREIVETTINPLDAPTGQPAFLLHIQVITERKQVEQDLQRSQERFSRAFLSSPAGLAISSLEDGRFVDANESYLRMIEYEREEVIGHTSTELNLISLEERARYIQKFREQGRLLNFEMQLRAKSGRLVTMLFSSQQIELDGVAYLLSTTIDITGRKHAEEKLFASEGRYRRLFEAAKDGILILDAYTGEIMDVNPFLIELLGYAHTEFLGKQLWEIGLFKDIVANKAAFLKLQEEGYIRYENLPLVTKDGRRIWAEFVSNAYDVGGRQVIQCNIRDITKRKQAEELIQRQLQQIKGLHAIDTAISSSFDIRVTLDIVLGQVISQLGVDAAAILLFDHPSQTMEYATGRGFRSNVLQHTRLKLNESLAGRAVREHLTIHLPDLLEAGGELIESRQLTGEEFVSYYGTPLIVKTEIKGVLEIYQRAPLHFDSERLDFMETLAGQAAIAIDNAQLFDNLQRTNDGLELRVARRTAELNQTNFELKQANRAKDAFLATMSHELRTPLNNILGLSETLLEQRRDPLSPYQQKSLEIITSSGHHLLELINDILDLSKIEAGKSDFNPQIMALEDLCRSSLAFVKEQAARKSITLTYQAEPAASKIFADPRRFKQILVNLLTNAVKFTPERGQVILQVQADAEHGRLRFSVIDNGIGIKIADLQQLFIPFTQVDSDLNREYEGTGLGLALTQKLADLHGGSVDVESEPGKGSRFTIYLPWEPEPTAHPEVIESAGKPALDSDAQKSNPPAEASPDRGIILLAEDNSSNILTIGDYLVNSGYQIVVAHDGLEAIEKAEEVHADIILMDIQMPRLDGLEAIRRLRADSRFASTPIIALTALAMPGDRERCLEAGANEYMSKPVGLKLLVQTIGKLLGSAQ